VIKLYSKISENFAKSIFNKDTTKNPILNDASEFFEKLLERFVGYIFYGCRYILLLNLIKCNE